MRTKAQILFLSGLFFSYWMNLLYVKLCTVWFTVLHMRPHRLIYQTQWFYIECTYNYVFVWARDSPFSGALCNDNKGWLLPWLPAVHGHAKRVRQAAIFTISKQGLFLALFPSYFHSAVLSLPFSTTSLLSQARTTPTFSLHFSSSFFLSFHLHSTP